MPSLKSSFLAVLLLAPLVHSSPVIPTALPAHTPWRLRNDPETLLGRRYVVQNHAPAAAPDSADNEDPPPPRSHAQHQTKSSKRSARFAKYLAERAATNERIQTPGGTVVNDVSNVGSGSSGTKVTKAGDTELEEMPSSYSPYNTAVTIVPRPSGTAHAKAADKAKNKSTTTHGKAV